MQHHVALFGVIWRIIRQIMPIFAICRQFAPFVATWRRSLPFAMVRSCRILAPFCSVRYFTILSYKLQVTIKFLPIHGSIRRDKTIKIVDKTTRFHPTLITVAQQQNLSWACKICLEVSQNLINGVLIVPTMPVSYKSGSQSIAVLWALPGSVQPLTYREDIERISRPTCDLGQAVKETAGNVMPEPAHVSLMEINNRDPSRMFIERCNILKLQ